MLDTNETESNGNLGAESLCCRITTMPQSQKSVVQFLSLVLLTVPKLYPLGCLERT